MDYDDEFVEKLLENQEVWNNKLRTFRDKNKKNAAWKKIGAFFKITPESAERKYKTLRERYRRAKAKMNAPSGSGGTIDVNWILLKQLEFLDDVQTPRRSYDNIKPSEVIETEEITLVEDDSSALIDHDYIQSNTEERNVEKENDAPVVSKKKGKQKGVDIDLEILRTLGNIKKRKNEEDDDTISTFARFIQYQLKEVPKGVLDCVMLDITNTIVSAKSSQV